MTDDLIEHVGEALALVDEAMRGYRRTPGTHTGTVKCPRCGKSITWALDVNPKCTGRQRQAIAFKCETEGCIRGSGH